MSLLFFDKNAELLNKIQIEVYNKAFLCPNCKKKPNLSSEKAIEGFHEGNLFMFKIYCCQYHNKATIDTYDLFRKDDQVEQEVMNKISLLIKRWNKGKEFKRE